MAGGELDNLFRGMGQQNGAGFGAGRFMPGGMGQQNFPGQQGAFPGQTPFGGFPGGQQAPGLMPWDYQVPQFQPPPAPPLFPLALASAPAPPLVKPRRRRSRAGSEAEGGPGSSGGGSSSGPGPGAGPGSEGW